MKRKNNNPFEYQSKKSKSEDIFDGYTRNNEYEVDDLYYNSQVDTSNYKFQKDVKQDDKKNLKETESHSIKSAVSQEESKSDQSKDKRKKVKSKKRRLKILILVVIMTLIINGIQEIVDKRNEAKVEDELASLNFDDVLSEDVDTNEELSAKVVNDYTFDEADIANYPDLIKQMMTQEFTDAQAFEVNGIEQEYIDDENSAFDYILEVGKDIEPGIYTITTNEYVNIDYLGTSESQVSDTLYYNIPLVEGQEIELSSSVSYVNNPEDVVVTFSPQSSYQEYEKDLGGMYIYGASNHESEMKISSDTFGTASFYYPGENGDLTSVWKVFEDLEVYGIPGSFFIVSSIK